MNDLTVVHSEETQKSQVDAETMERVIAEKHLGERIRRLRLKKSIGLVELGKRTGLSACFAPHNILTSDGLEEADHTFPSRPLFDAIEQNDVVGHIKRSVVNSACQRVGQTLNPLVQIAIGIAKRPAVDDLLVRGIHHRTEEQILDQQGIVIG